MKNKIFLIESKTCLSSYLIVEIKYDYQINCRVTTKKLRSLSWLWYNFMLMVIGGWYFMITVIYTVDCYTYWIYNLFELYIIIVLKVYQYVI